MVVAQHEQRRQAHKQRLANRQAAARRAGFGTRWFARGRRRFAEAGLRLRELVLVEQFADEIRRNRGNPGWRSQRAFLGGLDEYRIDDAPSTLPVCGSYSGLPLLPG